jgi:hypothetical protein
MAICYGQPKILDVFGGAVYAYSLRSLRSGSYPNAAGVYHRNLVKVTRASDNQQADFDFKDIFYNQIAVFCAGTTGTISTWYDQSGNGFDATGTVPPTVYESGSTILENAKPAIRFDGVDDRMTMPSAALTGVYAQFSASVFKRSNNNQSIVRRGASASNRGLFGSVASGTSNFVFHAQYYENGVSRGINTSSFTRVNLQTVAVGVGVAPISSGTSPPVNTLNTTLDLGYDLPGYAYLNGTIQELLMFTSAHGPHRTAIEKSINNYYKVY